MGYQDVTWAQGMISVELSTGGPDWTSRKPAVIWSVNKSSVAETKINRVFGCDMNELNITDIWMMRLSVLKGNFQLKTQKPEF